MVNSKPDADLFESSRVNITEHIKHIFNEKALSENTSRRKFRRVRFEGERQVKREIDHYNLNL